MYRRTVLSTLGAVAVAGCLGDNDNDSSSGEENGTDNDTANDEDIPDAEQLLPQPEGYTLEERIPQAAGTVGANNGMQGVYSGQGVDSFRVEILVYEDTETAANNEESLYTTWDYAIRVGTVLYAVNFLEQQEAIEVLAAVPELDRETVESNQIGDDDDGDGQTDNEHDIEIVAGNHEMEIVDATLGPRPHTVVPIENLGNGRSGEIILSVEYFDHDDRFAGESSTRVATLRPGETWIAEDIGRNIDGEEIQYSEIDLSVTEEPPEEHQEIEFFDTVYRNGRGVLGGRITGGVTNTGEDAIELKIIARLFDSEGRVTGDRVFSKGEIDPQEERNIEIGVVGNMRYERAGEDPEFELIPIETGFYF